MRRRISETEDASRRRSCFDRAAGFEDFGIPAERIIVGRGTFQYWRISTSTSISIRWQRPFRRETVGRPRWSSRASAVAIIKHRWRLHSAACRLRDPSWPYLGFTRPSRWVFNSNWFLIEREIHKMNSDSLNRPPSWALPVSGKLVYYRYVLSTWS